MPLNNYQDTCLLHPWLVWARLRKRKSDGVGISHLAVFPSSEAEKAEYLALVWAMGNGGYFERAWAGIRAHERQVYDVFRHANPCQHLPKPSDDISGGVSQPEVLLLRISRTTTHSGPISAGHMKNLISRIRCIFL